MAEHDKTTRPEEVDSMPTQEGSGDDGLGSKSGGINDSDERDTSAGGDRPGGDGNEGPVKGEDSPGAGGGRDGPSPGGVPQEGGVNPDADTASDST